MPPSNIYYFKSWMGFHHLEAMLNANGRFNGLSEQGELSRYMQAVSERLMNMPPRTRRYATLGVMNILQKFLGEGTPVNRDKVSVEQTVVGMAIAVEMLLRQLSKSDAGSQDPAE